MNKKVIAKRTGTASQPPSKGNVTIEMVAQLAGVSPSTVSRILNGTAIVSEDKRTAVDEAIATLGFVPNPMARSLAGGRSWSVGVITQAIDSPFYGAALRGIEEALDGTGYSPLFVSGHWLAEREARCIDILLSRRVDGIVVLTGRLTDAALKSCARKVPVVVTGRTLKAPGLFALNFDNFSGARMATEHLLGLGHRRIAFIAGDPKHPDANQRYLGHEAAMRAAGVPLTPSLVLQGDYTEASGVAAVHALLSSKARFTAILASNDQMAVGAALCLQQRGKRVPQDVSVVGFDDLPSSLYAMPPLTTVRHPAYDIGQLAAQALLALLAGTKPQITVPEPRLVLRASCAGLTA